MKNTEDNFDLIYLDPARRSDVKGKVFLLADTQPNPVENLDLLFSKSKNILIKVSPLLDLKNTTKELRFVKNIYVVSLNNEVKELLFHLEKDFDSEIIVHSVDLFSNIDKPTEINTFSLNDNEFDVSFSDPLEYLYEPSSAMMKTGAFRQITNKYKLLKIAQNSHLYTSEELIEDFTGRTFKIASVVKPSKKEIKKLLPDHKANITVRNYPMSVPDLRKKFKINEGGDDYLFFTTNKENKSLLIYGRKIAQ